MFSTLVVLSARLIALFIAAHANKKWRREPNKHKGGDAFFEVEYKHLTLVTVLAMHAVTSLLYFQYSMQANRNIHLCQEKHPFIGYPAAKHPKHNKLAVTDIWEKPVEFFNDTSRASTLDPAIILQT